LLTGIRMIYESIAHLVLGSKTDRPRFLLHLESQCGCMVAQPYRGFAGRFRADELDAELIAPYDLSFAAAGAVLLKCAFEAAN
jgi:hypothetical protein